MVAALLVFGQGNLSADQTISSLKPSADLAAGAARGIRQGPPPSGSSTPAPMVHASTGRTHIGRTHIGRTHIGLNGAVTTPTLETSRRSVGLTVDFAMGSAQPTPQARKTLDELGAAVNSSELANCRFRIAGHTDAVGALA